MRDSSALIARLQRIAATGTPRLDSRFGVGPDTRPVDAWVRGGLAGAQLHEVFAPDADDAASGAGFAVANIVAARALPVMWLRTEAAERAGGRLHATGLGEMGLDARALVLVLVADDAAMLRAAADAARCPGLGTVLIESWGAAPGLDLTATRRLMLAAESSGVTIISLRIAARPVPSAAATRWQVRAIPSGALAANAPGAPAFAIDLLRRRGGPAGLRWCVEWNRDSKIFEGVDDPATLSGADLSLVADREIAQPAPPSVRRPYAGGAG